jgi:hypothetical protein
MVSCDKNVYDEKRHGELIHYFSSVDSVDQQHMWMLAQTLHLRYEVPSGGNYQQLRLYTANPLTDSKAELISQIYVSDGQAGILSMNVPYQQTTLYAALVDDNGRLSVAQLPSSQQTISFSEMTAGTAVAQHKPLTYTYLRKTILSPAIMIITMWCSACLSSARPRIR